MATDIEQPAEKRPVQNEPGKNTEASRTLKTWIVKLVLPVVLLVGVFVAAFWRPFLNNGSPSRLAKQQKAHQVKLSTSPAASNVASTIASQVQTSEFKELQRLLKRPARTSALLPRLFGRTKLAFLLRLAIVAAVAFVAYRGYTHYYQAPVRQPWLTLTMVMHGGGIIYVLALVSFVIYLVSISYRGLSQQGPGNGGNGNVGGLGNGNNAMPAPQLQAHPEGPDVQAARVQENPSVPPPEQQVAPSVAPFEQQEQPLSEEQKQHLLAGITEVFNLLKGKHKPLPSPNPQPPPDPNAQSANLQPSSGFRISPRSLFSWVTSSAAKMSESLLGHDPLQCERRGKKVSNMDIKVLPKDNMTAIYRKVIENEAKYGRSEPFLLVPLLNDNSTPRGCDEELLKKVMGSNSKIPSVQHYLEKLSIVCKDNLEQSCSDNRVNAAYLEKVVEIWKQVLTEQVEEKPIGPIDPYNGEPDNVRPHDNELPNELD